MRRSTSAGAYACERRHLPRAGVEEHELETAERRRRLRARRLHCRGVAHVRDQRDARRASRGRRVDGVAIDVEQRDARALAREPRAVARPMPEAPPVISARWPSKRRQWKTWPPFTSSDCPVTTRERSEAKKTTASAISSEVGRWRSAVCAATSS